MCSALYDATLAAERPMAGLRNSHVGGETSLSPVQALTFSQSRILHRNIPKTPKHLVSKMFELHDFLLLRLYFILRFIDLK